jgi:hypothetical protein
MSINYLTINYLAHTPTHTADLNATASRLRSVPVLFSYGRMADPDPMPDPETPEWPVAWAAKEVLRRHLGPKFDRRLPLFLAKAILDRMRLTKWRISKEPPDPRIRRLASDGRCAG